MTPIRLGHSCAAALVAAAAVWFIASANVAVDQGRSLVAAAAGGLDVLLLSQACLVALLAPLLAASSAGPSGLAAVLAPVMVPLPLVCLIWLAADAPGVAITTFEFVLLIGGVCHYAVLSRILAMLPTGLRESLGSAIAFLGLAGLWLCRDLIALGTSA